MRITSTTFTGWSVTVAAKGGKGSAQPRTHGNRDRRGYTVITGGRGPPWQYLPTPGRLAGGPACTQPAWRGKCSACRSSPHGGPEMTHWRLGALGALAVLLSTAACGTGSATPGSGGATTGPSQPLAPLQGAFANVALPTGVQSLHDVDCPTARRCWAVGSTLGTAAASSSATVVTSSDGGATWKVQAVPPTVGYLTSIACTGARSCTAVGQVGTTGAGPGAVLTTQNGGGTWTLQAVPTGTTDVTAIACAPGGHCMALADVAGRVTALSAAGTAAEWVAGGALPATVSSAAGLSCTDADHCWATVTSPVDPDHIAGGIVATADGGVTWAPQTIPAGIGALQGIDCTPSPTVASPTTTAPPAPAIDCAAVGTTATGLGTTRNGQGVVLTTATGGATWSQAVVAGSSADLLAVSCGAGPCVAVGTTVAAAPEAGLVVVTGSTGTGPGAWGRASTAAVALPLAGVSCASLSACVIVGESVSAHLSAGR